MSGRHHRGRAYAIALLLAGGCGDDGASGDSGADGSSGTTSSGETSADDGPGPTSGTDETGGPAQCQELGVGQNPLRRLTRAQYANIVRDTLGVVADVSALDGDEKLGPFDSNFSAPISYAIVEQYRSLAEDVAVAVNADTAAVLPCDPQDGAACTEAFVASVGRRIFRRPLSNEEVSAYAGLAEAGEDFDDGIRIVVQGMLQSPHFLYHLEFGLPDTESGGVVELGGYELASRLSFFLWNSAPDDALLDAATAGELESPDGLRDQALRLLSDSRAREAVANFHMQWLGLDDIEALIKDEAVYPAWSDELQRAMIDETRRFSHIVVLQGDGKLETLLSANYSYIDGPLFELYGVEPPADHNPGQPVFLDPQERAGLITQASFLATHAHANQSGPIQRGVEIRSHIMCDPPPPPPPDLNVIPPDPDPDATTREIFEEHTEDPACAGCHVFIDGIGLGMEGYDGIGRYRTVQNGLEVDQSGEIVASDVEGPFNGGVELAQKLAQSQQVRECVSRQWFRYAFGRIEGEGDACSLEVLDTAFAESDYNVRELLLTIVQTDAFRYREALQ